MEDAWDPDNDDVPVSKVIKNSTGAKPGLTAPGQSSPSSAIKQTAASSNKQTAVPAPKAAAIVTAAPSVAVAATQIKNSIPVAPTPTPAKPLSAPPTF